MRKLFLLTGCVWTMLFTACDNTDYSDHSPFDNSAYLSVAEIRNVESFTFNRRVTEQTKKFTAKLTYPVGVDVTVRLQINRQEKRLHRKRLSNSPDWMNWKLTRPIFVR